MKAPLQPGKSFGSAAGSAPAQRKGGLKTITDNRPTAIAQLKLQEVVQAKGGVIQRGGAMGKMAMDAPTKLMQPGQKVFRATTQSRDQLRQAGGMMRLTQSNSIKSYRIPLYMAFSFSNPGVISTARTFEAAKNFAEQMQLRQQDEGGRPDPVHIYEIDAEGQKAIDMEKTLPKLFKWLYSGEEEEAIIEDIPDNKIKLLVTFGQEK